MKCPKCKSPRISKAKFCHKCGANLELNENKSRGLSLVLLTLVSLLFVSGTFYFFYGILFPYHSPSEDDVTHFKEIVPTKEEPVKIGEEKIEKKAAESVLTVAQDDALIEKVEEKKGKTAGNLIILPVGEVSIYDPWGIEISTLPAAILDSSWLALPARSCLGGVKIFFHASGSDFSAGIDGGYWNDGDEIVLWHLEKPFPGDPVLVIPWQIGEESFWRSLVSVKTSAAFLPAFDWQYGYFLHSPLPYFINEPGVFLQNGKVNGWTFGGWLEGGYFWNSDEIGINGINISVEGFYNITFAGGREEYFVRALALGDDTVISERLLAFLDGFRRQPKLDPLDVPDSLHPENVLREVRALARELRQQEMPQTVTKLIDADILRLTRDFELLKIVTGAFIATDGGYEDATDLVEELGGVFLESGVAQDFSALHLRLYQLWMAQLLEGGNAEPGWSVLERSRAYFPDDPQLYLDGVALYLTEGNWRVAEDLLMAREYPSEMRDRVEGLFEQIAGFKELEGKIVIHFSPGSNYIPVTAMVNGVSGFQFLVDTGASLVSIPPSMLSALGIAIDGNTPRRMVATAGGVKEALLVTLDSVEMQGWVVQNVEALVIEALESHDYGLLGLNFLSRFQMELDSDGGVLILKPR
ncbi:MAG: TIGR02281 family clan AA aspartic protease [Desulfobulbaceae bacterium]|nr:TIGR02281 family clan AA aspartic protease [Desulfobulbaceae bacterium]